MRTEQTRIWLFILGTLFLAGNALAAVIPVPSQYPTIQEAVDAALAGDTIRIAAGDYEEQIVIVGLTNLTLQGELGTVLHATDNMLQTLLPYDGLAYTIAGVVSGSDVTFRGLEFHGQRLANNYSRALSAIVFRGSSGRIENCNLHGFRGTNDVATRAVNVENHLTDGEGIRNIGIYNSTFSDNKASIEIRGDDDNPSDLRITFTLEGNTFIGAQPSDAVLSYGVGIRVGAQGSVKGNRISDHSSALGIAALDGTSLDHGGFYPVKPVICEGNIFSNNAVHLAGIAANDIVITNNIFARKAQALLNWGVTITGTNVIVADNNFTDMPQGIAFPAFELIGGVSRGGVFNANLANNWFTDVPTPVWTNALVRGLETRGTKVCCFAPSFRALYTGNGGKLHARVRTWHLDSVVLESSSDLKEWTPGPTNTWALPITEFEVANGAPIEFFRLRK